MTTPQPAGGRSRRKTIAIAVGAVVAVLLAFAALGNLMSNPDDAAAPEAAPSWWERTLDGVGPTTEAVRDDCPTPSPITDPDLAAAVAGAGLASEVMITAGRVTAIRDSATPDAVGVAVDVCAPSIGNADGLRVVATQLAKAIKASPLAARTDVMWVENYVMEDGKAKTVAKLKDPQFILNAWNGKPSHDAELARWEVLAG